MMNPRVAPTALRLALLLAISVSCQLFISETALARQAQQPSPDFERGLRLYAQKDMKGAAKAFRAAVKKRRDDHLAWLNLGRALMWGGDFKEALKAYDKAIKLSPAFADAHAARAYLLHLVSKPREAEESARRALELSETHLDARYVIASIRLKEGASEKAVEEAERIIKADAGAAAAHLLKANALVQRYEAGRSEIPLPEPPGEDEKEQTPEKLNPDELRNLKDAIETYERYLQLKPDDGVVRVKLEALRADLQAGARVSERVYSSKEVTSKAVILSKPEPPYTEKAREKNISGRVLLRAVLAADGTVRRITVINSLPQGLTEIAIAAAQKIKFKPATVNGVPVSQLIILEYNFTVAR